MGVWPMPCCFFNIVSIPFKAGADLLPLGENALVPQAADLAADVNCLGDDVAALPALDDAEVHGGVGVRMPCGQRGEGGRGDGKGVIC